MLLLLLLVFGEAKILKKILNNGVKSNTSYNQGSKQYVTQTIIGPHDNIIAAPFQKRNKEAAFKLLS